MMMMDAKKLMAVKRPCNFISRNFLSRDLDLNHVLPAGFRRSAKLRAQSMIYIHSDNGRQRPPRSMPKTKNLKRLQHVPKLPVCPRANYFFRKTDQFEYKFLHSSATLEMEADSFNMDQLTSALEMAAEPLESSNFCDFFNHDACLSDLVFWNDPQPLDQVPYESLDDILERALAPPTENPDEVQPQLQLPEERQYCELQPLVAQDHYNYEADDEEDMEYGRGDPNEEAQLEGVTFSEYVDRWHSENALFKVISEFPPVSPPLEVDPLGLSWKETLEFFQV